ncbi:MAG: zinc ribbon domain-containing protein [Thermoplasmata archaeon]
MFCSECGKEIPPGSPTCPVCGHLAVGPRAAGAAPPLTVDEAIADLRRAAHDVARSAKSLSRKAVAEAGRASKDPAGSAKRVSHKVAAELDRTAEEIERILRDL